MAHRRKIKEECEYPGCTVTACWEVFDSRGENYGNYCLRHAKMKEAEVAEWEVGAAALEAVRERLNEEDNNVRED